MLLANIFNCKIFHNESERYWPSVPGVKLLPLPQPPRARPYGGTDEPKHPESHPTKECARACKLSQYRIKLLLLSHNFSNVMINNTSSNEAH
jgi:hypothetical protein